MSFHAFNCPVGPAQIMRVQMPKFELRWLVSARPYGDLHRHLQYRYIKAVPHNFIGEAEWSDWADVPVVQQ